MEAAIKGGDIFQDPVLTSDHHRNYGAKEVNPYRFKYPMQEGFLIVNYDKVQQNWWFEVEDKDGKITPQSPKIKFW